VTNPLAPSPSALRRRVDALLRDQQRISAERAVTADEVAALTALLELAPQVEQALQELGQRLFDQLLGTLQDNLTLALQEILEQPIRLRADAGFSHGRASVTFYVERDGQHEDIMFGQGGSVANILSVGLRMFALATLSPDTHRRVLVLDEQDCWLRPDLVPRLVKIVQEAGRVLGLQVIMISHHDAAMFGQHADRVYRFRQERDGSVSLEPDEHAPA
jgi:hypothetical protein